MKKINKKLIISIAAISAVLIGCGGGGSSATTDPLLPIVSKDVKVERGPVYDSNVTDSSTPPQIAVQQAGKNIYTFAKTPKFPVVATGGWIDVNQDGNMTEGVDVRLRQPMKSYSNNITPLTDFVGDTLSAEGKKKLEILASKYNISKEDALKVPSEVSSKDTVTFTNALYKLIEDQMDGTYTYKPKFTQDEDDIKGTYDLYKDYLLKNPSLTNMKDINKFLEEKVVADLSAVGHVQLITDADVAKWQEEHNSQTNTTIPVVEGKDYSNIPCENNVSIIFGGHEYHTVCSQTTNRAWLDNELGKEVTDAEVQTLQTNSGTYYLVNRESAGNSYAWKPDFYQYGRPADGYEKIMSVDDILYDDAYVQRTLNNPTPGKLINYTLKNETPITFASVIHDWTEEDQDMTIRKARMTDAQWGGICPNGFRVPTLAEVQAEIEAKDPFVYKTIQENIQLGLPEGTNWTSNPALGTTAIDGDDDAGHFWSGLSDKVSFTDGNNIGGIISTMTSDILIENGKAYGLMLKVNVTDDEKIVYSYEKSNISVARPVSCIKE